MTKHFTYTSLRYNLSHKIGQGTYGEVYKGVLHTPGKQECAIKKIYHSHDGVHRTTIREIRILRNIQHVNIIELLEINVQDNCIFLVFPYYKYDIQTYLSRNIPTKKEIVHIVKQISSALRHLKQNNVLHRDIKTSNILVDINMNIRIADFGMAVYSKSVYTPGVVTLWYRPPEILLHGVYDYSCDTWGLGCIIGELVLGRPVFSGSTEIQVLESIIKVCGSINERTYTGISTIGVDDGSTSGRVEDNSDRSRVDVSKAHEKVEDKAHEKVEDKAHDKEDSDRHDTGILDNKCTHVSTSIHDSNKYKGDTHNKCTHVSTSIHDSNKYKGDTHNKCTHVSTSIHDSNKYKGDTHNKSTHVSTSIHDSNKYKGDTHNKSTCLYNLPQSRRNIRHVFRHADDDLICLIDQILVVDPKTRISIEDILEHRVFNNHDSDMFNRIAEYYHSRIDEVE